MGQHLALNVHLLLDACQFHTVFPEAVLPALLDVGDALHGLDGLDVEVAVVLERLVALLFELVDWVLGELFVVELAIGFGPGKFSRIVLGLEVAVALGSAETEGFAVVADEHDAVAGIDGPRAEVAPLYSHQQSIYSY